MCTDSSINGNWVNTCYIKREDLYITPSTVKLNNSCIRISIIPTEKPVIEQRSSKESQNTFYNKVAYQKLTSK